MSNNEERLQKVIAQSGVTSRRKAEKLIEDGKVKVNGKTVKTLGTKVTQDDKVEVDGLPLEKEQPVYYVLYKPRGVISSLKDDKGRKVITDLMHGLKERVYPVGRLDYDTSGIMLLTNDGDFAQMLMHPSHEVDKVYVAKIEGIPSKEAVKALRKGVKSEGEELKAVHVKILSTDEQKKTTIMQIVLHQGKNRQVRRMFEAVNHPVMKLKREQYGLLTLQGMQPGDYRELTPHEVKQLRNQSKRT
ncbi:ribosomal large subunit pseudouridine synthase B [Paraliobacillus quinghaiensis]|uniref:Pseudouridine synthase n=1 Tax=Paraliobacillus quinghaiensis TaxID=470815 RepID=A0A917TGJ6_9BACI|nr:pseudouridine synthase [Paraliobacillus quinghaiensis]GGM22609.1 ribosomal large subunit pseudouridine synthase B [Paraliobacillus quinghaiensis]